MLSEEKWKSIIGADWYNLLKDCLNSKEMNILLNKLAKEYPSGNIYPQSKDMFKAFKLCRLDNLKVIILGQDPYFDGSGTGLALANSDSTIKLNPSLEKIRDCIERDCYYGLKLHFDPTLENWAEQGVLLMNTALTVRKYMPGSHKDLWDFFTKFVISKLNENKTGLHFCLWGSHAKSYKGLISNKLHYIYEDVHPAYAARNNVDWKCNHFVEINKNIANQNGYDEVITW